MKPDELQTVPPPLVADWDTAALRGRCRWMLGLFLAGLLAMGCGDWIMRIHWFGWHRSLVIRPASTLDGPRAPMRSDVTSPARGGDLSHMLAIREAAEPFEEERPGATNITDEFGFRNVPPVKDRTFPVVVVGDSYMFTGPRIEDTFPGQLASRTGVAVYNHAYDGRGPFWGLVRFMLADRFKERAPDVLVWGIVEREMAGRSFAGIGYQMEQNRRTLASADRGARIDWAALAPQRLHITLPNTSIIAMTARKTWNTVRYRALGRLNPDVLVARDRHQLFYRFAADPLFWSMDYRNVPVMEAAIADVAKSAAERGIKLVVVLIPDKERIDVEQIPADFIGRRTVQPSVLGDLAQRLNRDGIPAVDLTPRFLREKEQGRALYWRDDTHWNPEGVRVAVEEATPLIVPLLKSQKAGP